MLVLMPIAKVVMNNKNTLPAARSLPGIKAFIKIYY
jgi:hypothetical protein